MKKLLAALLFSICAAPVFAGNYYATPSFNPSTQMATASLVGTQYYYKSITDRTPTTTIGSTVGLTTDRVVSTNSIVRGWEMNQGSATVSGPFRTLNTIIMSDGVTLQEKLSAVSAATTTAGNALTAISTTAIALKFAEIATDTSTLTSGGTGDLSSVWAATATLKQNLTSTATALAAEISAVAITTAANYAAQQASAAAATSKYLEIAAATASVTGGAGNSAAFTAFVSTAEGKIDSAGGFTLFSSSAGNILTFLNSTAAAQTTKNLEIASATGSALSLLKATAAQETSDYLTLSGSTDTLLSLVKSSAAKETTDIASLTTLINSSAVKETSDFNTLSTSTNNVLSLLKATATQETSDFLTLSGSTSTLLSLLKATATQETSDFLTLSGSTSTVLSLVKSSAAKETTDFNTLSTSTNDVLTLLKATASATTTSLNSATALINSTAAAQTTKNIEIAAATGTIKARFDFLQSSQIAKGTLAISTGMADVMAITSGTFAAITSSGDVTFAGNTIMYTTDAYNLMSQLIQVRTSSAIITFSTWPSFGYVMWEPALSTGSQEMITKITMGATDPTSDFVLKYVVALSTGRNPNPICLSVAIASFNVSVDLSTPSFNNLPWTSSFTVVLSTTGNATPFHSTSTVIPIPSWKTVAGSGYVDLYFRWINVNGIAQDSQRYVISFWVEKRRKT